MQVFTIFITSLQVECRMLSKSELKLFQILFPENKTDDFYTLIHYKIIDDIDESSHFDIGET